MSELKIKLWAIKESVVIMNTLVTFQKNWRKELETQRKIWILLTTQKCRNTKDLLSLGLQWEAVSPVIADMEAQRVLRVKNKIRFLYRIRIKKEKLSKKKTKARISMNFFHENWRDCRKVKTSGLSIVFPSLFLSRKQSYK